MAPREFLSLAERLSREQTEAAWRSAASRAYYAIFHDSRDRLASWGFLTRQSDQAHIAVSRRLLASGIESLVDLGHFLTKSKRLRNQADYELARSFAQSEAIKSVQSIESLLAKALNLSLDDQRLAIDNMRRYERDVLREVTWQSPN